MAGDPGGGGAGAKGSLEGIAALVAARRPDAVVRTAPRELAAPSIADGIAACAAAGAAEVVVHPYFLGPGNHSTVDIPRLVAEAAAAHPPVCIAIN